MADYSISAEITADSRKFNKGIDSAEKSLKSFSKGLADNINKLGKNGLIGSMANVSLAVGGLTKSFGTVIKFAKDVGKAINECTEAYKTQVIAERALDTAIQNNPYMTGASSQALKQFASDIQRVTNYGDEQLLPLIANLTSLGRTQEEVMQIVSVATDMASTGTMSLDSAIQQLNMTLNGNLGRLGMQNAELKDLTEEELRSGKAVEILGEKFKGLASATVDTSKQLANIKGDFKEALGEFTLPSSDMWNKFWAGFYEKGINVIKSFNDYLDREVIGKKVMQSMTANAGVVASAQGLSTQDVLSDLRYLKEQLKNLNDEELRAFQNYLANSKTRTQSEERMLTISKQILQSRGLQTIQDQKEAEAKKALLQDEQSIIDLKEKYLKLIAEQEAKWENIKTVTGEAVSNGEKLNFYQEQLVAIMSESNGQITENNQYYKDQMEIIDRIKSLLGKVAEETGDIGSGLEVTQTDFEKFFENLQSMANDWGGVISNVADTMSDVFSQTFTQIGKDLAEGGASWDNYVAIAVKGIAQILQGLASQLTVIATVKFLLGDFVGGATALAMSASSLIVSGAMNALANGMNNVSSSLEKFNKTGKITAETIKEIQSAMQSISSGYGGLQDYVKTYNQYNQAVKDIGNSLGRVNIEQARITKLLYEELYKHMPHISMLYSDFTDEEWQEYIRENESAYDQALAEIELYEEYQKALANVNNLLADSVKQIKEKNEATRDTIQSYKFFLSSSAMGSYQWQVNFENQLSNILNSYSQTLGDLLKSGEKIGEAITNSIVSGAGKSDFLSSMKDYIRENLIRLVVYTESFQNRLSEIGTKLTTALITGQGLSGIRIELEELWEEASRNASYAESIITEAFGNIDGVVEESASTFAKAMQSYKNSVKDLGGDIASNLVDGLTNGLSQSDFLSNMKQWIKKTLVQSVVYTESMKAEIEAIGKAITKGITEGFTDTSFDEIRRDLSFIFDQANRTVTGIDNVLNSVFGGGYAIGTNNATRGLHLVGEAGPELVRFSGGEQVLNAGKTQKVLAGGSSNTFNVNFTNVRDTSAYALVSQLKQYNRTMAINGVL